MKRPKCQAENRDGVKFCEDCGATLESICPKCNAAISSGKKFCGSCGYALTQSTQQAAPVSQTSVPTSLANGRYVVKKFLGDGGKKKVYLAHDTVLDRNVAFALIRTEKLDEAARTRIEREAQAMGRLGDHPNIVTVFDFGDSPEANQPCTVLLLLPGFHNCRLERKEDTLRRNLARHFVEEEYV